MPKIQRTEAQIRGDTLSGIIKKYMSKRELPVQKLAPRIGISESGLYAKIRKPDMFTWAEVCRAIKVLKIPAGEVLEFMGAEPEGKAVNVQLMLDKSLLMELMRREGQA